MKVVLILDSAELVDITSLTKQVLLLNAILLPAATASVEKPTEQNESE